MQTPSTASRSPSPKGGGIRAAQLGKFLPLWGRGTMRSMVEGAIPRIGAYP